MYTGWNMMKCEGQHNGSAVKDSLQEGEKNPSVTEHGKSKSCDRRRSIEIHLYQIESSAHKIFEGDAVA